MTDFTIAKLDAMIADATQGPWIVRTLENFGWNIVQYVNGDKFNIIRIAKVNKEPDAKLIASAPDLASQLRASLATVDEQAAVIEARDKTIAELLDGGRPLPIDRETLGRMVREAWVRWAETQPSPKPSWLVPYDGLSEPDKEADRQIGEAISRWTLAFDAARAALKVTP